MPTTPALAPAPLQPLRTAKMACARPSAELVQARRRALLQRVAPLQHTRGRSMGVVEDAAVVGAIS